jgi:heme-degrading monooxygenase HmoA
METVMIARTWHRLVPEDKAKEYHNYLLKIGVQDLEAVKGNLGVFILKRIENDNAHFQMISLWDSYQSIKKFAGSDYNLARYYPEDKNCLIGLDKFVIHYEVLYEPIKPGR